MYFVNRSEVEAILIHMDALLAEVKETKTFSSKLEKLGLERLIHIVIESIIDVGNKMIDGFIMRDPGSYHDIIDILIDESVLPANEEKHYKEMVDVRQLIVRDYVEVEHDYLLSIVTKHLDVLMQFSQHVTKYLDDELGVVNAFANEAEK